ncbi:selenium-dependent molybdenum cofactor biosynthesis protein YqeB [Peptoniphilus sp. oral taxon 386]|uniref:selenium-dependent molybdenum cofactor biosynthesis protein YqeB n=1 Tax=Peptoniphilus sp. oral taxon 386 TaxID=652713 RepID=UPI0001DA9AFF|nr:selenium-dependent molybdenum cofactor biosynthesis protein YqeB [Peptoniphilus sp. oral taxon 386]EFI42073.1 selenium-dependent molybdenum hydroxylase system protein, YqeB family [Peptoniphilus sp. oral taxon 386 str. F0131]
MKNNIVVVRGGGDIATGSIQKLYRTGFKVVILEVERPTAIRRTVALSDAIYAGEHSVEDVVAKKVSTIEQIEDCWNKNIVPIKIDPNCEILRELKANFLVDAILAKKNLGTNKSMADRTIALGPGFCAGVDVDIVIETNRGHNLGRLIFDGFAEKNTGNPGNIMGYTTQRVLYSPGNGIIKNRYDIGDVVKEGEIVATVDGKEIRSKLGGVLRGIIRNNSIVFTGMKIGDVDPRTDTNYNTISDKARAVGGAVLEAIMLNKI